MALSLLFASCEIQSSPIQHSSHPTIHHIHHLIHQTWQPSNLKLVLLLQAPTSSLASLTILLDTAHPVMLSLTPRFTSATNLPPRSTPLTILASRKASPMSLSQR